MFGIETKQIKEMERDLKHFAAKAFPFATRTALNDSAFQAQRIARADLKHNMTNRNSFTLQSIRVEQTKTLQVRQQAAVVGSIADYMEHQEFGAVKSKTGKEGVTIATSYSSGEGENAQPRTRLPRKPNRMQSIALQKRRKTGSSRKQQNFIAIRQVAATGRKFVFLDLGRRKGIFRVIGGKLRPKIKLVHDMTKQSVVIPKTPWLKPAFDETMRMLPAFYADALRFQLRRRNLFQ